MVSFDERIYLVEAWDMYKSILGDKPMTETDKEKEIEIEQMRADLIAEGKIKA